MIPAIQHRAARENNCRNVHSRCGHDASRCCFIAAGGEHHTIKRITIKHFDQAEISEVAIKRSGGTWRIGIVNPENKSEILQIFEVTDENIATSGNYEKGAHIKDPHTGVIAIGAKSGTVIGPDGGLSDAFATALMVDGTDAAQWIGNPELSEYTFWAINRHENTAWSWGPNLGIAE